MSKARTEIPPNTESIKEEDGYISVLRLRRPSTLQAPQSDLSADEVTVSVFPCIVPLWPPVQTISKTIVTPLSSFYFMSAASASIAVPKERSVSPSIAMIVRTDY